MNIRFNEVFCETKRDNADNKKNAFSKFLKKPSIVYIFIQNKVFCSWNIKGVFVFPFYNTKYEDKTHQKMFLNKNAVLPMIVLKKVNIVIHRFKISI